MENLKEEIGDVLFSVVNLSRFFDIPAEDMLRATNRKFTIRFQKIEEELKAKWWKKMMESDQADEIDIRTWRRTKKHREMGEDEEVKEEEKRPLSPEQARQKRILEHWASDWTPRFEAMKEKAEQEELERERNLRAGFWAGC